MMINTMISGFSWLLLISICLNLPTTVQNAFQGFRAFLTMACNVRCKNGICKENQQVSGNKIVCQCEKGWSGYFCDIPTECKLKCGRGKCSFKNGIEYCECPFGFEGDSCEIRRTLKEKPKPSTPVVEENLDKLPEPNFSVLEENVKKQASECAKNFVCHHGGYCARAFLGYKCQCTFPYTGVFCEELCDKKCVNGGVCFREVKMNDEYDIVRVTFRCNCPAGFQGEFCEHNLTMAGK